MPKIKNAGKTILIIPGGSSGKSVKINPKEEVNVEKLTDEIKHAEELGYIRFPHKNTSSVKKPELRKTEIKKDIK